KSSSVDSPSSTISTTLPPSPPSPPAGPPLGTYFSRRQAMAPLPPSPPRTLMRASSMKAVRSNGRAGRRWWRRAGLDADDLAPARLAELHRAGDQREEGEVSSHP